MRMRTEARVLGFFYKAMGNIELDRADPQAVLAFIGDATRPGRWRTYYKILSSFYRYALERGHAHRSALPSRAPKFPAQSPPPALHLLHRAIKAPARRRGRPAQGPTRPCGLTPTARFCCCSTAAPSASARRSP
jgi:hypothetical protein